MSALPHVPLDDSRDAKVPLSLLPATSPELDQAAATLATGGQILGFDSASAMLSALRERRSSADDLVALHLRRIAAYGPRFNSFAALSAGAPAAARAADAARARG